MTRADSTPSMEWLEAANRLETVARQLSSVVHEVNNMLQIVSGSAEILAMSADAPPSVLRRADIIGAQAQRAAALLRDVLTFSREAPDTACVDLREIASRAIAMRRYALSKARITERVELCGDDALVRANPRRLLQVALNLTMRAERAVAGQSDAQLSVVVSCREGQAVMVVEDNGGGPPIDTPGKMSFEPPTPDVEWPGSLSIETPVAAWLAAQEGGRLVLAPRVGGGSAAILSLPAA